jgi:hypothetical protein
MKNERKSRYIFIIITKMTLRLKCGFEGTEELEKLIIAGTYNRSSIATVSRNKGSNSGIPKEKKSFNDKKNGSTAILNAGNRYRTPNVSQKGVSNPNKAESTRL